MPDSCNAVYDGKILERRDVMYRNVSLAEAKLTLGNAGLTVRNDLFFRQEFGTDDLALVFPRSLPIGKDRRPIWPREVADSQSEPELAKLLGLYKGAEYVSVRAGKLVAPDFHLTGPRDCEHLMLYVPLIKDVESAASSDLAEFASIHNSLWHYHEGTVWELDRLHNAVDIWIIPTPTRLRPLLNRHATNFERTVRAADQFWQDYNFRKDAIRREMSAEFGQAFEQKGWGWLPQPDEAVLYYLEPDGTPRMRRIFYCDEIRQQIRELLASDGVWPE